MQIEGTPKEFADLVREIQSRQEKFDCSPKEIIQQNLIEAIYGIAEVKT